MDISGGEKVCTYCPVSLDAMCLRAVRSCYDILGEKLSGMRAFCGSYIGEGSVKITSQGSQAREVVSPG